MKVLIIAISLLATSSSVTPVAQAELLFIPAWEASTPTDSGPETLMIEIGQDGPLGDTCWSHKDGRIAKTGFIRSDGTVLWDTALNYLRCPAMD